MNTSAISNASLSLIQQTLSVQTTTEANAASAASSRPDVSGSSSIKPDQATLSVASSLISQALQAPDVRSEKVASLQAAIAAGTYQVSSSDVADKLVESLLRS